ncbi:hypothetical protein AAFN86_06840 [Roseomonas sp. CAU 1739]|uniref:hypothetical protein n=1 Tax=Roseomonas sp. CAU 1739 TaxID=3140364 RepID=UPI00325B87FB
MTSGKGRREVAKIATALIAGCTTPEDVFAQSGAPRQGGLVLAAPVPCADRPGDITGFLLEGFGTPDRAVVTIGQAFRQGDLPREARLAARSADGQAMAVQADVSVRHPDGSARFATVSLVIPAAPRGRRLGVVLSRATAEPVMPPLDYAAALSGHEAVLTISPVGGGTPWRASLFAMAQSSPSAERPWRQGPIAVQRRVTAQVPAGAVGGATSMRLVADIAVQVDGSIWLDIWFRNDIAMREGGGTATYNVLLTLDGRQVLRTGDLRHFQYQGWGRLIGAAPYAQMWPPLLRPDTAYLAETGAIAHYDLSTGVDETLLAGMAREMADPTWAAPLGRRGVTAYMETAGARGDIGATTLWQAAWLTTGDPRAAAYCLGQAETAGSVPWHMWDPRGGWMDERRWPDFWFDQRNGPPPKSLLQVVDDHSVSGWYAEPSHQPDLAFVPYLLSGRRAFLDELEAQAAWNVLTVWPLPRREAAGAAQGVNMLYGRQVRSYAWAMRQINEAAWISPDDSPQQAYFRDVASRNWRWARSRTTAWGAMQGEAQGWLPPFSFGPGTIAPWQQDYLATSVAAAARQGNEDARALLAWMAQYLVGRFQAESKGFARNDGAAFTMTVSEPVELPRAFYRTWAEIGAAMRSRGESNGTGWQKSAGEYGRLALQSLALLQDVLGHPGARAVYQSLLSSNPPPRTGPADHAEVPTNNITPRSLPRVPGRVPRCTATRR